MTRLHVALLAYVAVLLATDVGFSVRLAARDGIRVQNPVEGLAYPRVTSVEGDAWSPAPIDRIEVIATHTDGRTVTAGAARSWVRYRGRPVRPLAAYTGLLDLPLDGTWRVNARALLRDGRTLESRPRTARVSAAEHSRAFVHFGPQHLVGLALVAAACAATGLRCHAPRTKGEVNAIAVIVAAALWINEYAYHWYWFAIGAFTITNNFMLHMCGMAIVLIPFLLTMGPGRGRQLLFETIYFWGLGGAVQALLAPDIGQHGFPEFKTIAFFVSHGLICVAAIYMISAKKMTLTLASLFRGLAVTNLAVLVIYFVNLAAAVVPPYEVANYFMLGYPPPTGSIIDTLADLFGPSPRYIIGLEAIAVLVFLLIYLPFPAGRALKRLRARGSAA